MTVTVPIPRAYDADTVSLFEALMYMPHLSEQEMYQDLLSELGEDTLVLEHLVLEYLNLGATEAAYRVLQCTKNANVDLVRAVTIRRAREMNKEVYPLSVPAELWSAPHPTLFDPSVSYMEWYAARVEFIIEGDVTLRVRHVRGDVESYGTLIVEERRFPRLAEAGEYLEAVREGGTWKILFHDTDAKPLENPYL